MNRKNRKHSVTIGSVSSGTLRDEDLIDAFEWGLRSLRGSIPRDLATAIREFRRDPDSYEFAGELVNDLIDALNEFAPDYMYFGANEGDGADFGFWPMIDSLNSDFDGLKVSDTSEVPRGYRGHVMHVNDHGNVTLYIKNSRGLRELWSCV